MIQLLINIIYSFSLFLMISTSFSLIYYTTRYLHIAHAAIIALGPYFVILFFYGFSLPFNLSIVFSVLFASIIGVCCDFFVYKLMRKRNAPIFAYMIASIGLYVVLQNCISLYFGDGPRIINIFDIKIGNRIFDGYITDVQFVAIFCSFILFLGLNLFLKFSSMGKSIRAVASNSDLSGFFGISSDKVIFISFFIGSVFAAIAGILFAMDTSITPTFGFSLLLFGIVAMIIGGVGSNLGLVVGSLLISIIHHFTAYGIDAKWVNAVTYIFLILFLLWKPYGFSGKKIKKVEI